MGIAPPSNIVSGSGLTEDQQAAVDGAADPSAGNVFLVRSDIPAIPAEYAVPDPDDLTIDDAGGGDFTVTLQEASATSSRRLVVSQDSAGNTDYIAWASEPLIGTSFIGCITLNAGQEQGGGGPLIGVAIRENAFGAAVIGGIMANTLDSGAAYASMYTVTGTTATPSNDANAFQVSPGQKVWFRLDITNVDSDVDVFVCCSDELPATEDWFFLGNTPGSSIWNTAPDEVAIVMDANTVSSSPTYTAQVFAWRQISGA